MTIKQLIDQAVSIWKMDEKHDLIPMYMGVVYGDICRGIREDNDEELQKELGNMIFSTIRWAHDLGFDPEECIEKAIACQKKYVKKHL